MSKLTLYGIWLSGPTYKAGLALSLMGQPFAYKHVDLRAGAHKQPDYLAINRFGQVPALVDGDLKLCQSGPILLYLADKFGRWRQRREATARVRDGVLGFRQARSQLTDARHPARLMRPTTTSIISTPACGDALKVPTVAGEVGFLVGNEVTVADARSWRFLLCRRRATISGPIPT